MIVKINDNLKNTSYKTDEVTQYSLIPQTPTMRKWICKNSSFRRGFDTVNEHFFANIPYVKLGKNPVNALPSVTFSCIGKMLFRLYKKKTLS